MEFGCGQRRTALIDLRPDSGLRTFVYMSQYKQRNPVLFSQKSLCNGLYFTYICTCDIWEDGVCTLSSPSSTMHYFRRKSSSSPTPRNSPSPTPTSPIQFMAKEVAKIRSKAKNPSALAVSSSSIALSIGSPPPDSSDTGADEPGSSKESGWRTAYGAAKVAVDIAKESSDMFLPLKAVVGALSVLIQNYDVGTEPFNVSRRLNAHGFHSKLPPMQNR